ncbi:MAG TPA: hypothetical protein VHH12_11835, partial [Mycobacterium sp.]|nr:hypothetical protein [Mycobacterium sp.]
IGFIKALLRQSPLRWPSLLRDVVRRKGIAGPTDDTDSMQRRVRQTELRYPRLIYGYRARQYAGDRVTLIVNERTHQRAGDLGWASVASRLDVRVVPGDHITRLTVHGKTVADELLACLARASDREFGTEDVPAAIAGTSASGMA